MCSRLVANVHSFSRMILFPIVKLTHQEFRICVASDALTEFPTLNIPLSSARLGTHSQEEPKPRIQAPARDGATAEQRLRR
jgi:hypothetical protein